MSKMTSGMKMPRYRPRFAKKLNELRIHQVAYIYCVSFPLTSKVVEQYWGCLKFFSLSIYLITTHIVYVEQLECSVLSVLSALLFSRLWS